MASPRDEDGGEHPAAKNFIVVAFVTLVLAEFAYWMPRDLRGDGLDIWVYSDWLIDYSTGLVRRGLSGQLIWWSSGFILPTVMVPMLIWTIFGVVVIGYLRLIVRAMDRLDPIVLVGLLFLPSLLPFYLYDQGSTLGRKEMIGFILVLWHLQLLRRESDTDGGAYLKRLVPLYAIALPIHIFITEASLIQFVPVHLLLSDAALRRDFSMSLPKRVLRVALLCSPVFLAALIVARSGTPTLERVMAIYQHWNSIGAWKTEMQSTNPGAISAATLPGTLSTLFWTPAQVAAVTLATPLKALLYWGSIFSTFGFFTAWLGCTVTNALSGVRLARGLDPAAFADRRARRLFGRYFVLPFFISLPLYVVGWDFGRWFTITCFTYILVSLSPGALDTKTRTGDLLVAEARPILDTGTASAAARRFYFPIALLFAVCILRLPHCFISASNMLAWPLADLFRKLLHLPPPAAHPALAFLRSVFDAGNIFC